MSFPGNPAICSSPEETRGFPSPPHSEVGFLLKCDCKHIPNFMSNNFKEIDANRCIKMVKTGQCLLTIGGRNLNLRVTALVTLSQPKLSLFVVIITALRVMLLV
jgi:hypothetical protein